MSMDTIFFAEDIGTWYIQEYYCGFAVKKKFRIFSRFLPYVSSYILLVIRITYISALSLTYLSVSFNIEPFFQTVSDDHDYSFQLL